MMRTETAKATVPNVTGRVPIATRPLHRPDPRRLPGGELAALLRPFVDRIDATVQAEAAVDPFQRHPQLVSFIMPLAKAVNRYFSAEIRGWEHLPKDGPFLVVGNHSGGAQTVDAAPLFERWVEDRGLESPLYFLGYDLLFTFPLVGTLGRKVGLLRANPTIARQALERGAGVVVFPGGDYEVFRPWTQRNTIDFGGHTGFIELALSARVPVIPMTIHGAHQSTIVLTRGQQIAQRLGLERVHVKVFPFILNIPFGVTPAFVPSVQLPAKVTVEFGKPLHWHRWHAEAPRHAPIVRHCYEEITRTMQQTLDALARERPYPVLARLAELGPNQLIGRLLSSDNGTAGRAPATPSEKKPAVASHARGHGPAVAVQPGGASSRCRVPRARARSIATRR
jgi:1-acyl-sn-glycerol-3-phosphate acyltransferase